MLAEVRSKSGHDTFWRQRRVTEEKSKHRITRAWARAPPPFAILRHQDFFKVASWGFWSM